MRKLLSSRRAARGPQLPPAPARRIAQASRVALFACAAFAFGHAAFAQSALTYNDGDLLLGVRSTDGTSDYVVNLGQPSQFVNASSGTSTPVSIGNIGADLTTVFGSDWYSRIDQNTGSPAVRYAVVGGRQVAGAGDPANTLYSTNPKYAPWPRNPDTAQSFTSSLIAALGNKYAGNQSTANSPSGYIESSASSNSYSSFQPGGKNSYGISFQTWNPTDEGTPGQRLFLDRIPPGSGPSTVLGSFTLKSDGTLTFLAGSTPLGQLSNISTRLDVKADEDKIAIGGFIVTGSDSKHVIIRARGPSLAQFFPDPTVVLQDPTLELFRQGTDAPIATNDDWAVSSDNGEAVNQAGYAPSDSRESAISISLAPGSYTAKVRGKGGTSGIGIVEVVDVDSAANSQLLNISTRGYVEAEDLRNMIGGFIIGPGDRLSTRVVVRAIGPSLGNFGVTEFLPDPVLNVKDGNGTTVAANDDWEDGQKDEVTAAGYAPSDRHESAVVISVVPGNYTAIVTTKDGTPGVGLVEVYNIQ